MNAADSRRAWKFGVRVSELSATIPVHVLALVEQHGADGLLSVVHWLLVCRPCGPRSPRLLVRLYGVRGERARALELPRAGR
jgi:hypothetical protein